MYVCGSQHPHITHTCICKFAHNSTVTYSVTYTLSHSLSHTHTHKRTCARSFPRSLSTRMMQTLIILRSHLIFSANTPPPLPCLFLSCPLYPFSHLHNIRRRIAVLFYSTFSFLFFSFLFFSFLFFSFQRLRLRKRLRTDSFRKCMCCVEIMGSSVFLVLLQMYRPLSRM